MKKTIGIQVASSSDRVKNRRLRAFSDGNESLRLIMCRPHALVLSCTTGLIAAGYIALAVFQHRHFLTHAHDLGIFDQGVWQLSRFQRPAMTVRFMPLPNMFGDHFHPIILLLVPWYWVFDSPLVLLVAQALLFAATVPLGFRMARQLGIPRWPAVALAGAVGMHPGFTSAMRFDFHEVAFGPVLLLTTVLLAEQMRWRWYWLALAGFLLTKEAMAVYAAAFGITLMLRRQWMVGCTTALVGVGYLFIVTRLIMPALAQQPYVYWGYYQQFGGSPGGVVEHLVRHPISSVAELFSTAAKRHTMDLMLRSFLYLPVLSWTMWPVLFTTMAERFWTISPNVWRFHAQYQVIMTTVLFVSTLYTMHDAGNRLARWPGLTGAASVLVLVATAWTALASGVWQNAFTSPPPSTIERWHSAVQQHIPPGVRVSAQDPFVPHLSHRSTIYQFPRVRDAEYIILDPAASSWPLTADDVRVAQQRLVALGWRIAWQQDTTVIFQRTGTSEDLPLVRGWE
jgi:uncharacterized membrane protein